VLDAASRRKERRGREASEVTQCMTLTRRGLLAAQLGAAGVV